MLKALLQDLPPSFYVAFALFALILSFYGVYVGLNLGEDMQRVRCEALQEVPAYERQQLAHQICPEQSETKKP